MGGLNQRQSDAVFEVMGMYEGFVRMVAGGAHAWTPEELKSEAQSLHASCVEKISVSNDPQGDFRTRKAKPAA